MVLVWKVKVIRPVTLTLTLTLSWLIQNVYYCHTIRGLQITCIHTLKIIKPGLHSHIHAENLFLHVSAAHRQTREVISFPFQNRSNHSTFEKAQPRPGRPYQSCQLPSILKSK